MKLTDLDRVIEELGDFVASYCVLTKSDAYQGTAEWVKADTDVIRASKALTLLRRMREGAVEGHAWKDDLNVKRWEFTEGEGSKIYVPALLLISPEDS